MPRLRYDTPPVPADHESPLGKPVDHPMPPGGQMVWASDQHPPGPHPPNRPTDPPVRPPGGDTSPPRNMVRPLILGTPRVGSAVTATSGVWDGDPTAFLYIGLVDGVAMGPGSETPVHTLTENELGAMIAVRVRAANAYGYGEAESFPIGPVEAAPIIPDPPPVNTSLPVISGTAQIGHSLSSTPGGWTNNPSNYVYQWVRLPVVQEPGTQDDIPGAVNPTYLCQAADVGRHMACRVMAMNSEGRDEAISLPYGPVRDLDWNPPAWLIRDNQIHEYDPLRPRPALGIPTVDPVFGTIVTRVTGNVGGAIPGGVGNWGTVARHQGYSRQAWNCDQTLIYIQENSGDGAQGSGGVFLLGEAPYTAQFGRHEDWPAGADMVWHPTEPDLMDCARTNVYSHFNVRTGEDTVIRTFPGLSDLRIGHNLGNRSSDGKVIVFTALRGGRVVFAYEIDTDTVHPEVPELPLRPEGATSFTSARGTPDGRGILFNFNGDRFLWTDNDGGNAHTVPGGAFTEGAMSVGDVCLTPAMNPVFVGRVNNSAAGAGSGGTQSAWGLQGGGARTQLTTSGYLYQASTRADNINHTGHGRWAAADSRAARGGNGAISSPPYTCEIVLMDLQGGSLPYRICHHYNSTSQDGPAWTSASLSPDGQRCIFASAWVPDGSLGASPRPIAAFVADYRSATRPPDPVPPTNTVPPNVTFATGGPTVGNTAIGNTGTWSGANTFYRRWLRDGDFIVGATAVSYVIRDIDIGHKISVQVLGVSSTNGGYAMAISAEVGPVPDPTPPDELPWEPPSWVIYDRQVRDYNPARAKPGYNVPVADPNFQSIVRRISGDPGTAIPIIGGTWGDICGPNYINHAAWNIDQTLLYIINSGGTSGSIWLNGETYAPAFARGSNWPSGADVRWHPTNPDLMDAARSNIFSNYNVRTNTNTVIRTFAGVTDLRIGHNKGNRSDDGKIVVFSALRGSRAVAIVYDIERDVIINELDALNTLPGRTMSSVWSSPSGQYMIWNMSPDNYVITDFDGAIIWDFPTNYISHGDCCYDEVHDEVLAGRKNSSTLPGWTPNTPGGEIWKHRLRDGTRTRLQEGGWSPHTATRGQIPENQRYCVAATYDLRTGGAPQHPPYVGEIIMPKLDGTRVYRLCQHMGNNGPEYETFAFAVQSPDSGRVVFRSDWRAAGATPRPVQAYVVDIRT